MRGCGMCTTHQRLFIWNPWLFGFICPDCQAALRTTTSTNSLAPTTPEGEPS